jgi:murein DD-endopeptidase MepM/ murein hydrolase activator NlpD
MDVTQSGGVARIVLVVLFVAQANIMRAATAQAPAPAAIEFETVAQKSPGLILRAKAIVTKRWQRTWLWRKSIVLAGRVDLELPARGEVSRGYLPAEDHQGLDIVLEMKAPVLAAHDGHVVFAAMDSTGYGRMVMIDHGAGVRTLYGHLFQPLVKVGQLVKRGQLIGLAGNTGNSTGPHLHFEVVQNGVKLDPMAFYLDEISAPKKR